MNHPSIYVKGMILVVIPLFSQVAFLATLVKIRLDEEYAQKWALHASHVLVEADALSAIFAETHSSLRGYLITEDPELAERFRTFQSRTVANLRTLADLVADNADQVTRVQLIETRADTLSAWFEALYGLIAAKKHDEAVAAARGPRGEQLIDDVRAALKDFLQAEERVSAERQQGLRRQAAIQDAVLFGGGALAVLSTALLGYLFARGIAARLKTLAENARRIATGKELLAPLAGDDELGQLDRVFREMARSLDQKNQENEMFVYSVSHDLRSPLVNLQGFSQELAASCNDLARLISEADLPGATSRRAQVLLDRNMGDSIRFIQTAVTRLSSIIDALLRLSRAGHVEYRWQMVDVAFAVRRSTEALRSTLSQRGAEIVIGPLPPVWGDPTAIEQVFANLIGNAANYLDPERPGRIDVGALDAAESNGAAGNRIFFVRDNGMGIPEAHQAKVFIAFHRLHPDAARGEGIGLALVRRIVERHNGRIWLESTPGVGTTFYVSMPADAPSRPALVGATSAPSGTLELHS
jgi:signal transduction histidine kinase